MVAQISPQVSEHLTQDDLRKMCDRFIANPDNYDYGILEYFYEQGYQAGEIDNEEAKPYVL